MQVPEKKPERPLVLLIAARRAEPGQRPAVPGQQRRGQRGAGAPPRRQVRRQPVVEPEHLAPRGDVEAESRDRRRALQPAAAGRGGDQIAPSVDNVEVDRVALDLRQVGEGRITRARVAGGVGADGQIEQGRKARGNFVSGRAGAKFVAGGIADQGRPLGPVAGREQALERHLDMVGIAIPGIAVGQRLGVRHPKLIRIVEAMEDNLEEPLGLDGLAAIGGISRRQLERLFRGHLGDTPTGYYLKLRLRRARQFLEQTEMSVLDVSLACGFVSAPYFSRAYRALFGRAPRDDRRNLRLGAGRTGWFMPEAGGQELQ
ncbi:MAG: helix-turn-helix domain-containing protein [Proteobacteria bacterium]|nr:helix-turn-helix domain-containing protein [Pseudomonadota bacterium]